jgi:hypothetical protein
MEEVTLHRSSLRLVRDQTALATLPGRKLVLTTDHQRRETSALDPEYPGSGARGDSRVLLPAARVITLKTGMRS